MKHGVPPVGPDVREWASDMRRWLARSWDVLTYRVDGMAATQDGVMLWDTSGYPVVSKDGDWVRVVLVDGGTGVAVAWADITGKPTTIAGYAISDAVATSRTISAGTGLAGGGDLSANRTISLADTAVVAGSYGGASSVPTFTVDAQGRLTSAGSAAVSIAWGAVTGKPTFATVATSGAYADLTGIPSTFTPASHSHAWADITSGTPTTLAGYGITDAAPIAHVGAGGAAHADVVAAGAAGFMTGADKTKLNGIAAGANNYTHPNHSGDVISTGDGATAIANGVVTLAKMANMATASLIYRKTAGTGAPEVNTLATLKTDLGLTGTNSGDQTITLTGMITGSGTGTFAASLGSFTKAQLDAAVSDGNVLYVGDVTSNATHTGDVTGATALTIANDVVTNAKLADMATARIKGRSTAGTGDPEDLTAAQVRTLINVADGATANAGTVTSVSGAGTVSGLTLTGTVTGSGNLTLGGTLAVTGSQITDATAPGLAALIGTVPPPAVTDVGVTDNSIAPGFHQYNTGAGSSNGPANVTRGVLWHTRRNSGGGETQLMIVEVGTGINNGAVFTRSRVAGSWSAWAEMMTSVDIGEPDTNFVTVFEAGL